MRIVLQCGEPKKGHVCSVVLSNYKCTRCRLPKKSCTCSAPQTRSIAVQAELDDDMTTRQLDLSIQGYHDSTGSFSTFNQDVPLSNQVSWYHSIQYTISIQSVNSFEINFLIIKIKNCFRLWLPIMRSASCEFASRICILWAEPLWLVHVMGWICILRLNRAGQDTHVLESS